MGKRTSNEILAEYDLRAAGVAEVRIDADSHVGGQDVAGIDIHPAAVNDTIDKMGITGELRAFKRAFKETRKVDPSIRYYDYLEVKKTAKLEALRKRRDAVFLDAFEG